jgi:hypothetical protein
MPLEPRQRYGLVAAIVHQNHCATANVGKWTTTAVEALATRQLLLLTRRDRFDHMLGDAETCHELIVEHAHATCGDGAHCQFLISGDAKLADDKNIQRYVKRACHFISHGHAATR